MSDERDEAMVDYRLTQAEAQELRAALSAEEWESFLRAQRELLEEPPTSPSAGFVDRTMARLAARERVRARRRSLLGLFTLALGSVVLTALFVWSSPLGLLIQLSGPAALLDAAASLFGIAATLLVIVHTFATTLLDQIGTVPLFLLALFALALTLVWAHVVNAAPLARSQSI